MKTNIKLSTQQRQQQQQYCCSCSSNNQNDVALQVQPKYYKKQRQQQLLQSYKHCKRRRKSSERQKQHDNINISLTATTRITTRTCVSKMFDTTTQTLPFLTKWLSILNTRSRNSNSSHSLRKHILKNCLLLTTMLSLTITCLTMTSFCQPIEAAAASFPITAATSIQGFQIPPLNALLKAAAQDSQISSTNINPSSTILPSSSASLTSSTSPMTASAVSTSTQQQQRQFQQQQLFALLKLNSMPQSATQETKKSSGSMSLRIRNLKEKQRFNHQRHPPHHHLKDNKNNNDDYDDDDDDDEEDDDILNFPIPRNTLLETTGFVADDGQQYEKAEKALAAAGIIGGGIGGSSVASSQPQQTLSSLVPNNNVNCPKECKCLNDYFDCGKKHLDRVPALPSYVQTM